MDTWGGKSRLEIAFFGGPGSGALHISITIGCLGFFLELQLERAGWFNRAACFVCSAGKRAA